MLVIETAEPPGVGSRKRAASSVSRRFTALPVLRLKASSPKAYGPGKEFQTKLFWVFVSEFSIASVARGGSPAEGGRTASCPGDTGHLEADFARPYPVAGECERLVASSTR
jgi:hypothetical protein